MIFIDYFNKYCYNKVNPYIIGVKYHLAGSAPYQNYNRSQMKMSACAGIAIEKTE